MENNPEMSVLILRSADGNPWLRAILFPSDWLNSKADREYEAALKEAQVGTDWTWDDIETAMIARGFRAVDWHTADKEWDAPVQGGEA